MSQYEKACKCRIFSKRFLKWYDIADIRNNGTFSWIENAWLSGFVDRTIIIFMVTGK